MIYMLSTYYHNKYSIFLSRISEFENFYHPEGISHSHEFKKNYKIPAS